MRGIIQETSVEKKTVEGIIGGTRGIREPNV